MRLLVVLLALCAALVFMFVAVPSANRIQEDARACNARGGVYVKQYEGFGCLKGEKV